jgi:hypothetical protein
MPRTATAARPAFNGAVIYRGPSLIDPRVNIVCIVTGLRSASANAKTGDMLQTWIIRDDIKPGDAVQTRADGAICGGCPHRKQADGSRSCYVNVWQGPRAIFDGFLRGIYPTVTPDQLAELTRGRHVRLGSYGDPAAVPVEVWEAYTRHASGRTGYTHQWRSAKLRGVLAYCQASCDTAADFDAARALGAGTFRVKGAAEPALAGEVVCPASAEAGRVATCAECRMCDGTGRAVVINAHGAGAGKINRRALTVLA